MGKIGYCGYDAGYHIASVVMHRGEEPPISGKNGICNIFFRGCNLRCTYCQNFQISRKSTGVTAKSRDHVIQQIIDCLQHGAEAVGFVSPSPYIPHVKAIINELKNQGYHPVTVYNTNGYDKAETLRDLEGWIDVYLPDFKYMDAEAAFNYSAAIDYPLIAKQAMKEMFRQKGSTVVCNENGQAVTGLIVRHLVLPGHSEDSVSILKWIAEELTPDIHISLMSQYYPTVCVASDPILGRTIYHEEYMMVLNAMEQYGFNRGWVQDYESHLNYRPDFQKKNPFD